MGRLAGFTIAVRRPITAGQDAGRAIRPVRKPRSSFTASETAAWFTLESGRTFDKLADDLRGNLTTYKGHPATSGTMMEWMKEPHQAGVDNAYDALSNGDDLAGV